MVMDQFVTTYRKDFLWPYVRTFGIRPEPTNLFQVQYRDPNQVCACHCLEKPKSPSEQHQLVGPLAVHEESWSRQGPMGPLLNPKMYPAKVAEKPETSPAANYNQPNVFLHKLQEKYPFVYECLRQAPPSDMLARINRDRLRTTYQVDFCKMREHVSGGNKKAMYEARGPKEIVCPPRKIPKRSVGKKYIKINFGLDSDYDKRATTGINFERKEYRYESNILNYNPFKKASPYKEDHPFNDDIKMDPLVEDMGRMIYRDVTHNHGSWAVGNKK